MGLFDRFFSSRCPVSDVTRGWVVDRYAWLLARFGRKALRAPMVLPTPEWFPERFDGSQAPIESAMHRIATRLQVSPDAVHLVLHDESDPMREVMQAGELTGRWSQEDPPWARHLRADARKPFRQAMRCLRREQSLAEP